MVTPKIDNRLKICESDQSASIHLLSFFFNLNNFYSLKKIGGATRLLKQILWLITKLLHYFCFIFAS